LISSIVWFINSDCKCVAQLPCGKEPRAAAQI
jgi:hypothetical protein